MSVLDPPTPATPAATIPSGAAQHAAILARTKPLRITAAIALALSAVIFVINSDDTGLIFAIPLALMAWGMWLDKAVAWWLSAVGGVLLFLAVFVLVGITSNGGNDVETVVIFTIAAVQVLLPLARFAWTEGWGVRVAVAIGVVVTAVLLAGPVVNLLQNGGWAN